MRLKDKTAVITGGAASICGLQGARGGVAYTAAKHAIVGLSKNIGFIYADKGIRCNAKPVPRNSGGDRQYCVVFGK